MDDPDTCDTIDNPAGPKNTDGIDVPSSLRQVLQRPIQVGPGPQRINWMDTRQRGEGIIVASSARSSLNINI